MPKPLSTLQLSLLLGAMVGMVPFSVDAYLPALALMAMDLGATLHQLELTISSFILGYALGCLIGGPLSDHLGRRMIAAVGICIFLVVSLMITAVDDYPALLLLRFLQALGGGIGSVVVPAIVRDRYARQEAAKVMSTISFIMLAAPLLAPVVGASFLLLWGWRPIFMFLACYAAVLFCLTRAYLPESRPADTRAAVFSLRGTLSGYAQVLRQRQARPHFIALICGNSIFLIYITQAAFLINEYMGLSTAQFPLVFGGNVIALMLVNRCNAFWLRSTSSLAIFHWGTHFTLAATACLLLITFNAGQASPWVLVGVMAVIASLGFVNSNSQANFLHHFGDNSGTATALMRALQLSGGAASGAVVSFLYDGSPRPMAIMMLLLASVAYLASRGAEREPAAAAIDGSGP